MNQLENQKLKEKHIMAKTKKTPYTLKEYSSDAGSSLIQTSTENIEDFRQIGMRPILKSDEIPEGGFLDVILIGVEWNKNEGFRKQKARVAILQDVRTGKDFVIHLQRGLAISLFPEEEKTKESLDPIVNIDGVKVSLIGKRILIKKEGKLESAKYKDVDGKARKFSTWRVLMHKDEIAKLKKGKDD